MRFEPTTSRTTTWPGPLLFWTVLTARYGLGFFYALVMLTQGEPGYRSRSASRQGPRRRTRPLRVPDRRAAR